MDQAVQTAELGPLCVLGCRLAEQPGKQLQALLRVTQIWVNGGGFGSLQFVQREVNVEGHALSSDSVVNEGW